jgi:hypothetical protein
MVVGIAFVALFVIGIMAQLQTNEAYITNGGVVNVYSPNWSILWQPIALFTGGLTSAEAAATIFGWGIELIYLGLIVGYEMMKHAASWSGQMMTRVFVSICIGIVLFNGYTDYKFGTLGGGEWGHLAFAIVTSFIVGFFGTVGMYFIEYAWDRM